MVTTVMDNNCNLCIVYCKGLQTHGILIFGGFAMVLELFENIFQLVAILAALLISIFRYIVSRNRTWIYSVVFFLSSLLSCYFWTAYLIIMGSTPNVSDMLAYFGWNTSYLVLLL